MTIVPLTSPARRKRSRWPVDVYADFAPMLAEFDKLMTQPEVSARRSNGHGIDLYETVEGLVLEMAVPGVKAEQIDVSIEGRQLTVRGASEHVTQEAAQERRYWLQGITRGEFVRTIAVPSGVKADDISATVTDGILRVVMPKAPEAVARKIAVAQADGTARVQADGTSRVQSAERHIGAEAATEGAPQA
ncbi:MAG: Hsp20/alpha crystallin family protein [Trueperaceae bacterium]|nr:Hsp20/alpha crystallin family protein [Trueperaceae bacterium]